MADIKVYSIKQAPSVGNKWHKDLAVVEKEGMKLSAAEAKALNANYDASGRYYEIDEKATKAYLSSIKDKK